MAKLFVQDTTMTAIADAIREKTGNTAKLFPENMPGQIRSIMSGSVDTTGIDQGVIDEANRVASGINNRKTANSITFIAISDMHEMGDSDHSDQSIIDAYRLANAHAGQGAELVAKQINPDFFANLGDLAWGLQTYTVHDMAQSITNARVKTAGLERLTRCLATPGNHDIGYRAGSFDENLVKAMIGNYQFIDFDTKKIRVICANTSDISDGTDRVEGVSGEQLQWFAEALDLSGKADASSWGIIILSHHPLDWNANTIPLANCVASYINGATYSATHDGVSISKAYSGKNAATIIATFHGHVHCFKVANLSTTTDDNPVKRIAIPNACNGRNNEYGRDGNLTFGEPAADTCPSGSDRKSTIAGQDTAFCAITIDIDQKIIYADCFGSLGDTAPGTHAGYDRVISYAAVEIVTYSITNILSNAVTSNGTSTVTEGAKYTAAISAKSGYELTGITVTMGGVDITSTAVSGSNITIAEVTGNVVITVTTAVDENPETGTYTNLVPTSLKPNDSTTIFNGVGYKDDYYVLGDNEAVADGYTSTGGIYLASGVKSIYIRGCKWDDTAYSRMYIGSKETQHTYLSYTIRGDQTGQNDSGDINYFFDVTKLADDYIKLTLNATGLQYLPTRYYRLTLKGSGANLIVTHDEPIPQDAGSSEGATYTVTANVTNIDFNGASTAKGGEAYSATLQVQDSSYSITSVKVMMGNADVTSIAYTANDDGLGGTINITNVTGNITITAAASVNSGTTYTNLVPTLLDLTNPDSGTIFNNGKGYYNGAYLSTTSPYYNTNDTARVTTGFLPYTKDTQKPIYIKGVTYGTASHDRIGYRDSNYTGVRSTPTFGSDAVNTLFTVEQLGTDYFKLTPAADTTTFNSTWPRCTHIAFSLVGTGENLIITIDEPIE